MSDAAFKTGKYPAYTTSQLKQFVADGKGNDVMVAEIARRDAVAIGDLSQMTDSEKLRHKGRRTQSEIEYDMLDRQNWVRRTLG